MPALGTALGSSGAVAANLWTEINVIARVGGNGLVSFALTSSSSTLTRYASRETSSGNPPELVITTASASGAASTQPTAPLNGNMIYLPIIAQAPAVGDPFVSELAPLEVSTTVPANLMGEPTATATPLTLESRNESAIPTLSAALIISPTLSATPTLAPTATPLLMLSLQDAFITPTPTAVED